MDTGVMADIDNPVNERQSVSAEIKHIDIENKEQPQSYEQIAQKPGLVENSILETVSNEKPTNGYNEKDPPSPPSELTDKSTEKAKGIIEVTEKVDTTTKKRKVVENPFIDITPHAKHLVYWENPVHSGSVLAGVLSFMIFTSYFSLVDVLCYLAFYALFLNLLHVFIREQLQKLLNNDVVNPFEPILSETPIYIDRNTADKYITICINGINYLLLEGQQIALIDDPMRTFKYVIIFYISWSIMSYMSFQSSIITALILGFTLPKAYLHNKALVDQQLDHVFKVVYDYWERFAGIAKHHTKGYLDKVQPLVGSLGLTKNTKTTDKVMKEE